MANLRLGRRAFYALSPAIMGMLPMPGGALLSAPLLERAGGAAPEVRAAINVWFRHALLLVYPISSSLIATTKLAGLDVWQVIPYQLPALAVAAALGYLFLLRRVSGDMDYRGAFSPAGLLIPLGIILVAPALDFVLKRTAPLPVPELATGRIQAPAAIVIPIYLAQQGSLSPWGFAVIYFAVYLGYLLSPIHPCISVSVEYAGTSLGRTLRALAPASLLALGLTALAGLWLL
ncbi:DUF401 family protein [Candidatus Bipolaricaulota bacterium]|nr:DUF401 family protein [Candidatus Bipolaricaulota bacterium]